MKLIPTRQKERLPKDFSYAIGAEAISEALHDASQFDLFTLVFSWRDCFWASDYNAKIKGASQITVMEIGAFSFDWAVRLYAVPSAHRHSAREQLEAVALPHLKACLLKAGVDGHKFQWAARYDLATQTLAFA